MTTQILLILSGTLLWAYAVDIGARRLRLPAVIPLVASGLGANHFLHASGHGLAWLESQLAAVNAAMATLERQMERDQPAAQG
jgi:hypothetical protein